MTATDVERNVKFIRECTAHRPRWAVVLGSGFDGVADALERRAVFPFESLHGMPPAGVKGHAGRLVVGLLGGAPVAVFQGRIHLYEGHAPETTLMPVRIAAGIGARNIVLTNAAGGLDPAMRPGDLMIIREHVNLMPGRAALAAAAGGGSRAEASREIYDAELSRRFMDACLEIGVRCGCGVYAGLSGPAYETGAESRYLRALGADAVGMSTVHEAAAARGLGMRVLGVSCISNVIGGTGEHGPDHDSVLAAVSRAAARMPEVLEKIII